MGKAIKLKRPIRLAEVEGSSNNDVKLLPKKRIGKSEKLVHLLILLFCEVITELQALSVVIVQNLEIISFLYPSCSCTIKTLKTNPAIEVKSKMAPTLS